jgi:hypothetical protein
MAVNRALFQQSHLEYAHLLLAESYLFRTTVIASIHREIYEQSTANAIGSDIGRVDIVTDTRNVHIGGFHALGRQRRFGAVLTE